MSGQRGFDRSIWVYVWNQERAPLVGATIEFKEDGQPRGSVPISNGRATIFPSKKNSIVEVEVRYQDETQRQTLAVDANQCNFEFEEKVPDQGNKDKDGGGRRVAIWVAAIPAVVALIVGYWQFVYKPASTDQDNIGLTVFVKDQQTGEPPVAIATVSLQLPDRIQSKVADGQGTAKFTVPSGKDLVVSVRAPGYHDNRLNVPGSGKNFSIEMPLAKASGKADPPAPQRSASADPTGTWHVRQKGDPTLQRIGSGRMQFALLSDGQVSVSGRIRLDGMEVTLQGTGNMEHSNLYVHFTATREPQPWEGDIALQRVDASHMQGDLKDADGKVVPLSLQRE